MNGMMDYDEPVVELYQLLMCAQGNCSACAFEDKYTRKECREQARESAQIILNEINRLRE